MRQRAGAELDSSSRAVKLIKSLDRKMWKRVHKHMIYHGFNWGKYRKEEVAKRTYWVLLKRRFWASSKCDPILEKQIH